MRFGIWSFIIVLEQYTGPTSATPAAIASHGVPTCGVLRPLTRLPFCLYSACLPVCLRAWPRCLCVLCAQAWVGGWLLGPAALSVVDRAAAALGEMQALERQLLAAAPAYRE